MRATTRPPASSRAEVQIVACQAQRHTRPSVEATAVREPLQSPTESHYEVLGPAFHLSAPDFWDELRRWVITTESCWTLTQPLERTSGVSPTPTS